MASLKKIDNTIGAGEVENGERKVKRLIDRYFSDKSAHPFSQVGWEKRDAVINDGDGNPVFSQTDVEVPSQWSALATNVVVSKYFRGKIGTDARETSVKQLISRVASTIAGWGLKDGYFSTPEEATTFEDELSYLIVNQMMAFNSPVWFNVGVKEEPQCSACFILSVDDSMESILEWYRQEGMIFKGGSGSGVNVSAIRGEDESLSNGGVASGPLSFMRAADASAGVIKSGGKCLAPDQRVMTENGPIAVKELSDSGKSFIVLSHDPEKGRYAAKVASASHAGRKVVVRIVTDKGEFRVSSDHPMRLSSGEYSDASQLAAGMSLFSCAIKDHSGYQSVSLRDGVKGREFFHRLIVSDVVGEDIDGMVVHHVDSDPSNNSIDNLSLMTQAEHAGEHGRQDAKNGKHVFQRESFIKAGALNGMHSSSPFWENAEKVDSYKLKQSEILTVSGRAREMQSMASRQKMINNAFRIMNSGGSIDTFDDYVDGRKSIAGKLPKSKGDILKSIESRFGTYDDFAREVRASNHRVLSVEEIGCMDVYDVHVECTSPDTLTEDSGHNYVIWSDDSPFGSGVVTHNTRRAAKMVVMNADHPDIEDFTWCKVKEEEKAWALIDAGYGDAIDGEAYGTVSFQNANNSVRVNDDFMQAVVDDGDWELKNVTDGDTAKTLKARTLFREFADAAHQCGDPGVQFDTTINDWHTCTTSGRINASNPCSEYMSLDNSACNLASLNLVKFLGDDGSYDVESLQRAVDLTITAQDIIVSNSSYPTEQIGVNARAFRQLGLGYANLGALLMSLGLPYDSKGGREYAAAITSVMCGRAYRQSSIIATKMGAFDGYEANESSMLKVLKKHQSHAKKATKSSVVPLNLLSAGKAAWDEAVDTAGVYGVRNSQSTVLAPTGTIAFMMDCDTTGVEPDIALVKYKKLVGGGVLKIVNNTVRSALGALGYEDKEASDIIDYIDENDTIEGAPHLDDKHLPVFDCAFKSEHGQRSIDHMGHIKMMGAVQPFISGAISKTVNLPTTATVEDVETAYMEAWKRGVKAIAVYRDGCKRTQPLNTSKSGKVVEDKSSSVPVVAPPARKKLHQDCYAIRHKFDIAGHEGYLHVGLFEDGSPGEVFIKVAKEGSTIAGLMDAIGILTSLSLQYGVPLSVMVNKFSHVRFEPSGFTKNKDIPMAKSLIDYIYRFLELKFMIPDDSDGGSDFDDAPESAQKKGEPFAFQAQSDAPFCSDCGAMMVRNGACYKCFNCGGSSGCS